VYYLHGDHLGSTSLSTDSSGQEVTGSRTLYYPYGEERWSASGGTLTTDYGFTGQRRDVYIDMIEMGARWYNPQLGRFVSADTIIPDPANPQSLNRFSYVVGNPLKYRDPTGHYYCGDIYDPACLETDDEKMAFSKIAYDGHRVASYAYQYRNEENPPGYEAMSNGSDCTSYSSQALVNGGLQPTSRWHYAGDDSPNAWRYTRVTPERLGQTDCYGGLCDGLYNYLTDDAGLGFDNMLYEQVPQGGKMTFGSDDPTRPGDVVFYSQDLGQGELWTHAAVVVGWGPQFEMELDAFLATNKGEFASHNQGGGLTLWIAEHSGSAAGLRPVQGTFRPVEKIAVVQVGR
ncbi:MAG: hypothetical protein GY833_24700, partial [Aestuariibacter sp.]|nr:hypothetical protein [Aestuariibacter sp.]